METLAEICGSAEAFPIGSIDRLILNACIPTLQTPATALDRSTFERIVTPSMERLGADPAEVTAARVRYELSKLRGKELVRNDSPDVLQF